MTKAKALEHLTNPFHWVDLTNQQARVIKEACRGRSAGLIAVDMGVSYWTVVKYLRDARIKINLTDRSNLSLRDLPGKLLDLVEKELRE